MPFVSATYHLISAISFNLHITFHSKEEGSVFHVQLSHNYARQQINVYILGDLYFLHSMEREWEKMAVFSQGVAILRYRALCVLQLNQAGHSKACCALFLFSSLLSSPLDYNFQEKSRVYPSFTSPSQKYVRTTLGPAFFLYTHPHMAKQNKTKIPVYPNTQSQCRTASLISPFLCQVWPTEHPLMWKGSHYHLTHWTLMKRRGRMCA